MAAIHKSRIIDARAAELFDIIDNPENFARYVPNVSDVVDIKRSDKGVGDSYRVIYKVLGVTFDESFTTTERARPNRLVASFEGGMSGTFGWTLEESGPQTKLTIDIVYAMPGGAVGKAMDSLLLERVNEKSMEGMLENLSGLAAKAGSANR
jgi:ribosome-associated toxin RatA of RatAB toxin-antitoxin module